MNEIRVITRDEVALGLPIDQRPAVVYLATLGKGSRPTMRVALDNIARLLAGQDATLASIEWAALRFQHVAAVRAALLERYAPATVRRHLSALKGVLKTAYRLGQISFEDYGRCADMPSVQGETLPTGKMLRPDAIAALMNACALDPSAAGVRDAAIIALGLAAGPRRAELVSLDVADYDPDTGGMTIRHAKGSKERIVYAYNGPRDALDEWLQVRGDEPGPLFIPVHQSGRMRIERLSTQALYNMLRKRAKDADIGPVSPHDLRRTAISNLIDEAGLAVAQKIAGHCDPKTTVRYDLRGERAKQAAAAKISVPYRRRIHEIQL